MTPHARELIWSLAAIAGGLAWLWLLVALSRLYEPLSAYALAAVPLALFGSFVGLREWRWHLRRRRRLLEEEFRR